MNTFITVAVVALVIWLAPLGLIWALNTLFGTGIAYGLPQWAAALLLLSAVGGSSRAGSKV